MSAKKNSVQIHLEPLGKVIQATVGASLQDALFAFGVEFPCGGRGLCKGCRIRVLKGTAPASPDDLAVFSEQEIAEGTRLACHLKLEGDLTIRLAQWEMPVLLDHADIAFALSDGLGIAMDVGTTTLAAQLVDLATGHVLGVQTALNPQAKYGADVMSRIAFATEEGRKTLTNLIRDEIKRMISNLVQHALPSPASPINRIVLVGNTPMHHLFCDIDVTPLSQYPFESEENGLMRFSAKTLNWEINGDPEILFLPCLGGFVGSDLLAGVLATGIHTSEALCVLLDIGTNGEILIGNHSSLFCASTAAGPAFEGGCISMGMRATTGAISRVRIKDQHLHCDVIGPDTPRGICGSGLVDAVACACALGLIQPSGRLADQAKELLLAPPVHLTQKDVREIQLAKGALAAGITILLDRLSRTQEEVAQVHVAGAFGNAIDFQNAQRIGLAGLPNAEIRPSGNTALAGAKLALFIKDGLEEMLMDLRKKITHVPLQADARFQEIYVAAMAFPEIAQSP